jgi:hypothetical protein
MPEKGLIPTSGYRHQEFRSAARRSRHLGFAFCGLVSFRQTRPALEVAVEEVCGKTPWKLSPVASAKLAIFDFAGILALATGRDQPWPVFFSPFRPAWQQRAFVRAEIIPASS